MYKKITDEYSGMNALLLAVKAVSAIALLVVLAGVSLLVLC